MIRIVQMNTWQRFMAGMGLLFILSSCAAPGLIDSTQLQIESTLPFNRPIGQTFIAHHAGLTAIDLYLDPKNLPLRAPILHLRQNVAAKTDLVSTTIPIDQITTPSFYRFAFSPQLNSHGRSYYMEVEGANLNLGMTQQDRYADGALYRNGIHQTGDMSFREVYDQQVIVLDLFFFGLRILQYTGLTFFLYILPGFALLSWLWRGQSLAWEEQLGLSAGLSLALYPILLLWLYLIGVQPGPLLAWLPGAIGLVVLLLAGRKKFTCWLGARRKSLPSTNDSAKLQAMSLPDGLGQSLQWHKYGHRIWQQAGSYGFIVLVVILIITHLIPVRMMVAPAWGDSVHHTIITQLMLDNGGLFQSWEPYAPIRSFTYHFSLHIALANWVWLSGMATPQAVLIGSQMLNVLAILAIYPLAVRLAGGNRWAGVAAVIMAGLLSPIPAFYVNWGRYTQLVGQIILPVGLWSFDVWWGDKTRPSRRTLGLVVLLCAGAFLSHYRIALLLVTGAFAWAVWGLWLQRRNPVEWVGRTLWVGAAGLLAIGLVTPWLWIIQLGKLPTLFGAVAKRDIASANVRSEIEIWRTIDTYYPRLLWLSAPFALAGALWKRRTLALPLLLWGLLSFLATNPFLLHLPGTGWVTNFLVLIGLYIPIALASGWLLGWFWQWLATTGIVGRTVLWLSLLLMAGFGAYTQLHVVDSAYQMVTPADQDAFTWIKAHTPVNSRFLVNGMLAYYNSVVVGTDAGWWLPLYTARENSVPPIFYNTELLKPGVSRAQVRQLEVDVRASQGDAPHLRAALCRAQITHVYIGQRQGQVGDKAMPTIPAAWLRQDPDFKLLYQEDNAQVWAFDRTKCY